MNALVMLLADLAAAGVELRGNRPFLLHRPAALAVGLSERLDRHREALLVLLQYVRGGCDQVGDRAWLVAMARMLTGSAAVTDTMREAAKPRGGGLWA
jgi:hypothetical protein